MSIAHKPPGMGSEDFSFMMEQVPGAYINRRQRRQRRRCTTRDYDFNDEAIPFGSALFARLIERKLPRGA